MPPALADAAEGMLRADVRCEGQPLGDDAALQSLVVRRAIDEVPEATVVLHLAPSIDGAVSDPGPARFAPGRAVEIAVGHGERLHTLFSGTVVSARLTLAEGGQATLTLQCRHRAASLQRVAPPRVWSNCSEAEVMAQLIGDHGLVPQMPKVFPAPALAPRHEAIVQPGVSDWSFLRSLAHARGLWLIAGDSTLRVRDPQEARPPTLKLQWGSDLIRFEAELQGDADPTASTTLRGTMRFPGTAQAEVGEAVELSGLPARFSAPILLTQVVHSVDQGGWQTEASFRQVRERSGTSVDGPAATPPSARPAPAPAGLQRGVVVRLDGDPQGEHRLMVHLPALGEHALWARRAQLQASPGSGLHVLPQPGDDVLVGWLHDDPTQPVVLGSLHSRHRPPPHEIQARNPVSAWVTPGGATLEFDDDRARITLRTPGRREVVLCDATGGITVSDPLGHQVTLDATGVTLRSAKDLHLHAAGTLTLDALQGVKVTSPLDVSVQGLSVDCSAQLAFSGRGGMSAEVSSPGATTVKGALLLLNP